MLGGLVVERAKPVERYDIVTKTVCVFGHSHVWSVRRVVDKPITQGFAFEAPLCGTQEMPGPLLYEDHGNKQHLTSVLTALLNRLTPSPDLWLLSMVHGNYYNQIGMLTSGQTFDFTLPDEPDLPYDATATNLPYLAVKAAMEAQMVSLPTYLQRLKMTEFGSQTLIAGTCPPPRDSAYFKSMLEEKGLMAELAPAHVRLKLWKLQDAVYADMCHAKGMAYVSGAMPDTQDQEGFLLPEYIKDAVHANGDWAALFLKKVAATISRRQETQDD